MRKIRKHLSYANVISSFALFLALSGGVAFAASHLARNSVGSAQLKRNAVISSKVKNGAVTSAKIGAGAVGSAQLGAGSVGNAQLANGAVSSAKIANDAVGAQQVNEGTLQGLVKGNATQSSHSVTAPSVGFLPAPLTLSDMPGLGAQVALLFCGSFESTTKDQMRVLVRAVDGAPAFIAVNKVEASNLPVGTNKPEFVDFGGGSFGNGGGEPLLAELPGGETPGPLGIVAEWDFQLYRGDDPNTSTAHVHVTAFNDSTPTNIHGQCHVTAETIAQP